MTILRLEGVWKQYQGSEYVLKDVNLELNSGQVLLVMGPNGSGKTTLLKICGGLLAPSRGRVLVNNVNAMESKAKRYMGVLLHEPLLYPELTVSENLELYAKLKGAGLDDDVLVEVLKMLQLEQYMGKRVRELSYGWRKRVDLLRALLGKPKLLLLDEPLSSLDPIGVKALLKALTMYVDIGSAVMLTSPYRVEDVGVLKGELRELTVARLDGGVLKFE